MVKTYNITITGLVQGVWFRAFTREAALRHRIKGWVRNQPDGSVYCQAQGNKDDLNAFLDALRTGPANARVDAIRVEENEKDPFESFTIRY